MYAGNRVRWWALERSGEELTVSGSVVEMEMSLLETLTVIALRIAQTEESFFQEIILFVPKGKGDVLQAMGIGDTSDTVFTPSVGS